MKDKNAYTWNAKDYANHSSAQQGWARERIAKLRLHGHESLLDVGCGDGKVTAEIATLLPDGTVTGCDSSAAMIELASDSFPKKKYPNLAFELADARCLPFENQFTIVFSNAALHWVKDHRPVLSGIKRCLKTDGRLLAQMGGKGNAEGIFSVLNTLLSEKKWQACFSGFEFPYGFYDPKLYRLWLENAGLAPLHVELIPKDMTYKDRDGLAGWIRTTWLPYLDRVPEHLKQEFVSTIVETYIGKYPLDEHGNIHVGMVRLDVEAINRP